MATMSAADEKRFARVQGNVQANLKHRMQERQEIILSRLVAAYRGEQLSSEMLFGGIAAISELRAIINEADRDLMQATDAMSNFQG